MKRRNEIEGLNAEEVMILDNLCSEDPGERYMSIRKIRNMIIGINSRKKTFISLGLIDRLLQLMVDEDTSVEFAVEGAVILGSIARGGPENFQSIVDSQTIPILCKGICHHDERLVMACLRSLRICFLLNEVPAEILFEDENIITNLVNLLYKSSHAAECVANILQQACKTCYEQSMLFEAGVIPALTSWLDKRKNAVLVPVLGCLSSIVFENEVIANQVLQYSISLKDELITLMTTNSNEEIQLAAAICLSSILRATSLDDGNDLLEKKILALFVGMCQPEKSNQTKLNASRALAYMIEDDGDLQAIAAISNHLIKNIGLYFTITDNADASLNLNMREGAFRVFAALSANDEKLRKQVVDDTANLVKYIHEGINQDGNPPLQTAAMLCLLSLSRSVQQLRTTFQEVNLWEPVITALKSTTSDDLISIASSVLCNLLLDFSPCKESLVECGVLDVLLKLIKRDEDAFRVNGTWGLMNLAYDADDTLKGKIFEFVGVADMLKLLEDSNIDVAVKSLGLLRNLISEKEDIDDFIKRYGFEVVNSVKPFLLNDESNEKLKEQALCLLSNIAYGSYAKELLLCNVDVLVKVIGYLSSPCEQLQVASVFCITNFLKDDSNISVEQWTKLREMGVEQQLRSVQGMVNANLSERVKLALERFT